MDSEIIIYHNARCSKSRGALEILQERNLRHTVRWYLKEPLSREEWSSLLRKLQIRPLELIRKNEAFFKENLQGKELSDEQWMEILMEHPELMERPIVEKGDRAIIARPPEKLEEIL